MIEASPMGTTQLALTLVRTDGGTQPRAELNQDVVQDYAQAMLEGVQFPPIILFCDGSDYWLADGFHRFHAAKQSCMEAINVDIRQGTCRDAVLYSVGANASHGLRRTNVDKRKAVETLLRDKEWGKWSNREIARRCGVVEGLVRKIREELSAYCTQIEIPRKVERNGTVYTMNTTNIGTQQDEPLREPTKLTSESTRETQPLASLDDIFPGFAQWQKQPPPLPESWKLPPAMRGEPPIKSATLSALQSSDSNEWFTPAQYVDAARKLMGAIDVDPASCELANETIKAKKFYAKKDNGLFQPWSGRVWLNPPYGFDGGASNQELWTRQLIERYTAGLVTEAVLLVNANTEAKWFQPLYNYLICFTDHRIRFYNESGNSSQPTQGNALVYFGKQDRRFIELFSPFGTVVRRAR